MKKFLISALLLASTATMTAQTLAFPTAEGFGKYASGGRGGEVVEVTNLTDDPVNPAEGSFRWALKQHEGKPLTIVFRVSGTIDLKGNDLRSNRSNVTIAGQTAPGDGICFKGGCLNFGGSRNLIVRHIRSRLGVLNDNTFSPGTGSPSENFIPGAAFNIENGGNFIIDHCSFGWSPEENVDFYDDDHVTVQWCMFEEALYNAGHGKGMRSFGAVFGGKTGTYHHNLLAHNYARSPRFSSTSTNDKVMLVDYVNNVNYNWGRDVACYGGENKVGDQGQFQLNMVNNYYKPGPARPGNNKSYFVSPTFNPTSTIQSSGKWHLDGNYMEGDWASQNGVNEDNYKAFSISEYETNLPGLTLADMKSEHLDVGEYAVNTESAQDAYNSVLDKVGAFPRDAQDARIVNEVRTGTAQYHGSWSNGKLQSGIIDKPSDVGGYPELKTYNEITDEDHDGMDDKWETDNGFDPTNPADRNTVLKGGYTALDAYLCSLVGETIEIERQATRPFDIVVAKDGTGDYTTINAAIEAAPEEAERTVIFVKNGTYNEKVFIGNRYAESKKVISIIGESKDGVIITWDDYNGKQIDYPGKGTISADGMTCPTMTITAPDFYMENVTVRNTIKDDVSQAVALYQAGDRQVMKNVSIEGYQDTHRHKKTNRFFYYDCTVKGNTDFIYGGGAAYYYKCNIVSRPITRTNNSGGYITAPEDVTYKTTLQNGAPLYYEYFFNDCKLTAEDGANGAYFSRPWADNNCGTIFLNCFVGNHINPEGFAGNGNNQNMCFGEYGNMDLDGNKLDLSKRVAWAQQLTEKDIVKCGLDKIYKAVNPDVAFDPIPVVVGVAPVTNVQESDGFVTWTGLAGTRGYIVYNNGKMIAFTDGCSYNDPEKRGGTYSVRAIALNGALSPMNDEAYTLSVDRMRRLLNPVDSSEPGEYERYTISLTCSPEEGGSATASKTSVIEGESVMLKAVANDGYAFKNWTLASGVVLGTEPEITIFVENNMDIVANFTQLSKELGYHTPENDATLGFELTYLYDVLNITTNAATGNAEYTIQNDFSDWVHYNEPALQVTNRNYADMDARTGEKVTVYWFDKTEPYMSTLRQTRYTPVVGMSRALSFSIKDCTKVKIYFNGSSSTPGTGKFVVTEVGGEPQTFVSSTALSKNTAQKSDVITADLDKTKSYNLTLQGTSDLSVWAIALWGSGATGIQTVTIGANADHLPAYNLAGQKVGKDYKGIVIIGGKKVVRK